MTISAGFWPSDIKPDIQTPLAILKPRAAELTQLTKGILVGQVSTTTDTEKTWLFHSLDAVAPALNNLRQRLLTVKHRIQMIYPAFVDAEVFEAIPQHKIRQLAGALAPFGQPPKRRNEASTDEELIELLKQALNSSQMKSTLVSLIALANEATEEGKGEYPEEPPGNQAVPNPEPEKPDAGLRDAPNAAEKPEE